MKELIKKIQTHLEGYDFFDTLKHTSTYFTATILINALGIISLPVYTSFLTTAEFGIVEIFNNTIKVLAVLMTFNTHQAVGRYYFEGKKDWNIFLGTSLITTFFVFVVVSIILFISQRWILYYLNIPQALFYWFFPATISLAILAIFSQLFVAKKQSFLVSKGQVLFSYGRFFGAVIGLLWVVPLYFGRVIGDVILSVFIAAYLFYKIWPHIKWKINLDHLKYNLKFSLPLIPYSLSGFILNFFDLFMINSSNNSDAGIYAFAYKIGFLFLGLDQALHNATKPDFYKIMNSGTYELLIDQIKSMLKFHAIGATFLILFASDIGYLLARNAAYTYSLNIVPIIVIGYLFFASYNFYARLLFYSKKTYYISIITLFVAFLNIVLNIIYIPLYGYEAAAYTTLASFIVMLILGRIVVINVLKLPAPPFFRIIKNIGMILLLGGIMIMLLQLELPYPLMFCLKILIFGSLGVFLFGKKILSFFDKKY